MYGLFRTIGKNPKDSEKQAVFFVFSRKKEEETVTGMKKQAFLVERSDLKPRCRWCNPGNPLYVSYHDREWGVPSRDDGRLFETLLLECFQAGLSWECVLNKREAFRWAFDGFDPSRVACYDVARIETLLHDKGIVRNRLKLEAAVANARVFLSVQREFGSFGRYIWGFTGGRVVYERGVASSPLSDAVSADLKRRGMKFVGTTVVYAYLQAIGVVESHDEGCWLGGQPLVRTATPVDLDEIAALEALCFPEAEAAPREAFAWRLAAYPSHFLLLEKGGRIVSFVNGPVTRERDLVDPMYELPAFHREDAPWQMVFGVVTRPDYRRRGYAGMLLERFAEQARREGRKGIVLTCKTEKVPFYERFGFVDEGVSASLHGGVPWRQMRLTF